MKADVVGDLCPLLQKACIERDCAWYTKVRGKDPQSTQEYDHWGCAVAWLPVLLIENSQMQRQTGAAVESFRNEVVTAKARDQLIEAGRVINGRGLIDDRS